MYKMTYVFELIMLKGEEEQEEITPELVARLVTRPEDLPQNVAANIRKYRDMMLRTLEVRKPITIVQLLKIKRKLS